MLICEEINYRLQQGCKKFKQPANRKKNSTESAFSLDRRIMSMLNKTNACENMNNLLSGRPWLAISD
jgi:hypothetical protein